MHETAERPVIDLASMAGNAWAWRWHGYVHHHAV